MRRSVMAPVAVVAVAVISGGWLLQQGVDRADNVYMKVHLFQEVVDRVESSFVDEVEPSRIYNSAIDGILADLHDPYSSFLEASDFEDLRIRGIEGDYGGVGLEVVDRNGMVTVVSPMPGTPGARAGIRAGDQFYEIGGVAADTMDTDQAVAILRGKPGSKIQVRMLRPGVEDPIPFTLSREVIQLKAVPFAAMLEDDVGYVPFQSVLETSSAEIQAAVDSLKKEGMKRLVLDLRGNPGGVLDGGIAVSDLFLARGLAIVETRGRASAQNETYNAATADRYAGLPMVILVDGGSASASEIVAGALQDHDRAVLLGESTFGKGLVQSLYRLSGGNVLRLTTARWYTPVGRSINKDPNVRFTAKGHGALGVTGQLATGPDLGGRPTYKSSGGRTLFGGGGIAPDVFVSPDTLTESEELAVRALYRQAGAFSEATFSYAVRYVQEHPSLAQNFSLAAAELEEFRLALPQWQVQVAADDFRGARRFVTYQLEREISLQAWGDRGEFMHARSMDRQLGRAIELLRGVDTLEGLLAEIPPPVIPAADTAVGEAPGS